MKKTVKILHSSCCATNSPIRQHLETIAEKHQLSIDIEELKELHETMVYNTFTFPSLVVDGEVYDFKKVNTEQALVEILK